MAIRAPEASQQQAQAAEEEVSCCIGCLNKIPICGGFCAPTKSTEQSCLRHFSNETTPPQPCIKKYFCRLFWEHNCLCRLHGKLGLPFGDKYRHYIMLSAFCVSFTAWILQFAAIAAMSTSTGTVENMYWAKADILFNASQYPPHGATVTSYMGIYRRIDKIGVYTNALKVRTTDTVLNRDWDANTTCVLASTGEYFPGCKQCGDTATGTATLLITSVITQIFQMTTDLQRTTRYGDLHCQKTLGTITGIYGFYSSLQAMHNFMSDCTLTDWDWFTSHTEMSNSGTPVGFNNGPGLTLLFVATIFKLYDVLCHVIVPVAEQQNEYIPQDDCCSDDAISLEEYMGLNTVLTSWNNTTGADMLKEEPMEIPTI